MTRPATDMMRSLPESHGTIAVPRGGGFWRRLLAFIGPGWLVAVGYMDPGNWATDIAGGSAFGYTLLSVILLSNLMAIVLQALAARLGIGAGLDLAQACRAHYRRGPALILWLLCEIAIIACDLAEVLGTAIALKLLFNMPLLVGVCVTTLDVFLILALQRYGFRRLEAFIAALLIVIAGCFAFELAWAGPDWRAAAAGLVPTAEIVRNPAMLYIAIGILGATVMPHNLYLHSAIVQTRAFGESERERRDAIRLATVDSTVSLGLAFFINAAILVLAAATFHVAGRTGVAEIEEAHRLLAPMLGVGAASTVFAIALLASGQNSTVTGTLAGQIVMEGFLDLRLPMWLRRLVTRALAIVPAVAVIAWAGDRGATPLLLLSQVILSLQLPFAVVPLVAFTGSAKVMGAHAAPRWLTALAWVIAALIVALNAILLWGAAFG
ncbi:MULTISPECIES: Nramp family divalent metal transporter [unclassified Sphingomonas]|uniref:Nramp family divalent metal transporter n=1 Tax=unclassified Sphingomonas TaxID=196159 RepID=UPI00092C1A80|nr:MULTISPECIES: Nramp family divalent metal transporter [unclassified Sphingomonas]OJU15429.1 MAG: divalent metal cation transporter [Sphingomonas sp. 66-10]